jgi:hypothetical protein
MRIAVLTRQGQQKGAEALSWIRTRSTVLLLLCLWVARRHFAATDGKSHGAESKALMTWSLRARETNWRRAASQPQPPPQLLPGTLLLLLVLLVLHGVAISTMMMMMMCCPHRCWTWCYL